MSLDQLSEPVKNAVDTAAIVTGVATLFDILPSVAALLSIVWLGFRIAIAVLEHRIKGQEHLLNKRKIAAQDEALISARQHWNATLKEGLPPDLKRLLDQLK